MLLPHAIAIGASLPSVCVDNFRMGTRREKRNATPENAMATANAALYLLATLLSTNLSEQVKSRRAAYLETKHISFQNAR